jgi:hypothetical protein
MMRTGNESLGKTTEANIVLGNNPRRAPSMGLIWIVLVSADGLEPSTHALKGHCSTN